jgi:phosphate transport system permease protein
MADKPALTFSPATMRRQIAGRVFAALLLFATLFGLVMLAILLVNIGESGSTYIFRVVDNKENFDKVFEDRIEIPLADEKTLLINSGLVTNYHSRKPERAGLLSALVGSLIVMGLVALFTFPLGVGAAIYLEEYAPPGWLTEFIKLNIYNLAGVPSIVYGMLGLAVFGHFFGLLEPDSWFVKLLNLPITESGIHEFPVLGLPFQVPFGNSLLAGGLTMTLLVLPIVVIAAREALRAVPSSIREAAYAVGATRWQTVSQQVMPVAMPGILTGMILALSRAMGESAPLLVLGAFIYVPFLPESVWDKFTVLPLQIYNWISLPKEEFRLYLSGAGIIILLVVLMIMNGFAIYLRNRFEKRF